MCQALDGLSNFRRIQGDRALSVGRIVGGLARFLHEIRVSMACSATAGISVVLTENTDVINTDLMRDS